MSGLFGTRTPKEKTVLIVDIENGSVGCALVRLEPHQPPKLFAETRTTLAILPTLSSVETLIEEIAQALRETLIYTSETAARMRNHESLGATGNISSVSVFIAAPWASTRVHDGRLAWHIDPLLRTVVAQALRDTFGEISASFHPTSTALGHTTNQLFDNPPTLLLCAVLGEVTELGVLDNGTITARATMPLGSHFLIRTLASHGGLSHAEARSALRLSRSSRIETPVEEALLAAGRQFASELGDVAGYIQTDTPPQGVLIISQDPIGELVAQALGNHGLPDAFNEETTVQALHTNHVIPYLAAHAAHPDMFFMTEALFINNTTK